MAQNLQNLSSPERKKKKKRRKRGKQTCFVMDIYGLYIWHELSSLSDITELRPLSDSISTYKVLIWMWVTVSRGSVMYWQNPQGRYLQNQSTGNFPSYIFSSAITVQWTSIRCKGINWGILWPVFSLCEDVCIVRHLDAEVTKFFLNIFVFDKKKYEVVSRGF